MVDSGNDSYCRIVSREKPARPFGLGMLQTIWFPGKDEGFRGPVAAPKAIIEESLHTSCRIV